MKLVFQRLYFKTLTVSLVKIILTYSLNAQCNTQITSFAPGERVTYEAYYNWGFIWIHAGDVSFSVYQKLYGNKPVYVLEALGFSLPSYDWAYKVRDKYQTLVDMETFSPLVFEQNTSEGGHNIIQTYTFSAKNQKIYIHYGTGKKPGLKDTVEMHSCTFDVLSAIYYCRNLNFSTYKKNETIPFDMLVDDKIFPMYIRYLGLQNIHIHDEKQKFECIKFAVLLVPGTTFKGGEDMIIYITNDQNRIPVLIEAKILIGSVKAYLNTTQGLRNPETSRITK